MSLRGFMRKIPTKFHTQKEIVSQDRAINIHQGKTESLIDFLEFHYYPTAMGESLSVKYSKPEKGSSAHDYEYQYTSARKVVLKLFFNEVGNRVPLTKDIFSDENGILDLERQQVAIDELSFKAITDKTGNNTVLLRDGILPGRKSVKDSLRILKTWTQPDKDLGEPPFIEIARMGEDFLVGRIENLTVKVDLWDRQTSEPRRAIVTLNFRQEYPTYFPFDGNISTIKTGRSYREIKRNGLGIKEVSVFDKSIESINEVSSRQKRN